MICVADEHQILVYIRYTHATFNASGKRKEEREKREEGTAIVSFSPLTKVREREVERENGRQLAAENWAGSERTLT